MKLPRRAFCRLAKRACRRHISGMSAQNPNAKLTPPDAALAALSVAQKLTGCGADALHGFLDRQIDFAALSAARRQTAFAIGQDIVDAAEGFDTLLDILAASLTAHQSATIYLLCADFIAQHGTISPEEMRFLERLGEALAIDRLTRAAFDRAAQARAVPLTGNKDD